MLGIDGVSHEKLSIFSPRRFWSDESRLDISVPYLSLKPKVASVSKAGPNSGLRPLRT